jgi:hypothetical protein
LGITRKKKKEEEEKEEERVLQVVGGLLPLSHFPLITPCLSMTKRVRKAKKGPLGTYPCFTLLM